MPEKEVACVTGEGSIQMMLQELSVLKLNLPKIQIGLLHTLTYTSKLTGVVKSETLRQKRLFQFPHCQPSIHTYPGSFKLTDISYLLRFSFVSLACIVRSFFVRLRCVRVIGSFVSCIVRFVRQLN